MIEIAHSQLANATEAAAELRAQVTSTPRLVIFFASPRIDPEALAAAVHEAFGGIPSFGCTTAGELLSGAMHRGSAVLMALDEATVERAAVAAVTDVHDDAAIDGALESLSAAFGAPLNTLDPTTHLGLVVHDGLSLGEEKVMDHLSARTNVPFVGGSAGDDVCFDQTFVFSDGRARRGASALLLLALKKPYRILKTQSFDVLDTLLRVTEVDEATRTVRAFNGEPASVAYARAIGVPVEGLAQRFQDSPLGLVMPDGEPFVRSPQRLVGEHVVFYCRVSEGMELHLLRGRDIVADTRRDLEAALASMGGCQALINFHCILRTLELDEENQRDAYGAVFRDVPTIGLSTYGESYVGHINQTSTMVLFG